MNQFLHTVLFRIILLLGACITPTALMGGMAITGLARLNSNMKEAYGGIVVPLAQRSATAALEIKELIGNSVSMMQDGSRQAAVVRVAIGQVKQSIRQVADIVGEITGASDEQSRRVEQVDRGVTQMDDVTHVRR